MTMFEKIYDTLESLNIPVVKSFYNGHAKSYCIVSIYNEQDWHNFDNTNDSERYKFYITFWFDANEEDLSRKIKKLLKDAGIRVLGVHDNYDDGFYGRVFDCQALLWNEELDSIE